MSTLGLLIPNRSNKLVEVERKQPWDRSRHRTPLLPLDRLLREVAVAREHFSECESSKGQDSIIGITYIHRSAGEKTKGHPRMTKGTYSSEASGPYHIKAPDSLRNYPTGDFGGVYALHLLSFQRKSAFKRTNHIKRSGFLLFEVY